MKLQFSPADEAFRMEVREFVKRHVPADIRRKVELGLRLEHADYVTWFRILEARGWLTPGWPVEHGGPGWSHVQRYIFDEETLLGGAPRIIASGIQMLGPVLHAFGTEEQKQKYLPDIRQSNTWWAQGFSEPGAGSDLAAVRTTAVREPDGKHFVGERPQGLDLVRAMVLDDVRVGEDRSRCRQAARAFPSCSST
jgi:alkylation response protein AidB-like acyl-CoA dehydrogenase